MVKATGKPINKLREEEWSWDDITRVAAITKLYAESKAEANKEGL